MAKKETQKEPVKPLTKAQWRSSFYIEKNGVKYTNHEWMWKRFSKQAVHLGNGVYQFDGIYICLTLKEIIVNSFF